MNANDIHLGSDDNHQSSESSQPIAIPNKTNGEVHHHTNNNQYSTLTSSSSSDRQIEQGGPDNLLCRPPNKPSNSPWGTDQFLSCSPFVSGRRGASLRLPDLDLREARYRATSNNERLHPTFASAEFATEAGEKRKRSKSLGSEGSDQQRLHSSLLMMGEKKPLKRKTPSGLSLLDLMGDVTSSVSDNQDLAEDNRNDNNTYDGYGATQIEAATAAAATAICIQPLTEPGERSTTMRTSQSCTIDDLNPSPPPPNDTTTNNIGTEDTLLAELKAEFDSQSNPPILSLLYGLVNTSIVLPVLMSFGSIIYHDDFFRPYLSVLMKLTVVSGAVHQITFSTVSSLPFAVGQVQDAGLIFLSSMARDLVVRLRSMGVDDTSILATITIGLSLYTAVLGCALILVGRFRLASYCQLLPSSVIAGYLAYIGFFCGQAGLALMASVDVTGLSQWYKFFDSEALMLLTPGLIGGCAIYFSVRTFRHMAVLPSCIVILLAIFYGTLWATDTTVKEATENGWINETVESPSWLHTWDFLRPSKVEWRVLPTQTLPVLAMICVVALSSSLDIAAIEIELKRPLDYNHELKTVGLSNIISGITGGYTGSYIFSQTIFSLRMGIRSRLMGYILAVCSLVAVVIPINILAYIPNFFFGSLLMMICLDLMFEWLIDVRHTVTPAEYFVVISTFGQLQILGVEFGIIGGILLFKAVQKMGYDVGSNNEKLAEDVAIAEYETQMQS